MLYLHGRGVDRDAERAEKLLKIAISNGYKTAIYRYAVLVERGEGINDSNPVQAEYWYRSALRNGSGEAALALSSLFHRRMLAGSSKKAAKEMRELGISMLADDVTEKKMV